MNAGGNEEKLSEPSRLTLGGRLVGQPSYTTSYGLAQKKEGQQQDTRPVPETLCPRCRTPHLRCPPEELHTLAQ